jgi:hypothetical protein
MTTAAATAVGMVSEADINIGAGKNKSESEAAIIMTVAGYEKMRIDRNVVRFKNNAFVSQHGSEEEDDDDEYLRSEIAIYPDQTLLNVGTLQLFPGGIRSRGSSVSISGSALVLNSTASENSGVVTVGATLNPNGLPLIMKGQEAYDKGGNVVVVAGSGDEAGGDVLLDGGAGRTRNGDVNIGSSSRRTKISSNYTSIDSAEIVVNADKLNIAAPAVFDDDRTRFSNEAVAKGASFAMYATTLTTNNTLPVYKKSDSGYKQGRFYDTAGILSSAYEAPGEGGVWSVASRCSNCIMFGDGSSYVNRYGTFSLMVEGITATVVNASEAAAFGSYSVTCAVLKLPADYADEGMIDNVKVSDEDVVLIASARFSADDEYVSLSGSKLALVEGGVDYGVLCRGVSSEDGGGKVMAEKITLALAL